MLRGPNHHHFYLRGIPDCLGTTGFSEGGLSLLQSWAAARIFFQRGKTKKRIFSNSVELLEKTVGLLILPFHLCCPILAFWAQGPHTWWRLEEIHGLDWLRSPYPQKRIISFTGWLQWMAGSAAAQRSFWSQCMCSLTPAVRPPVGNISAMSTRRAVCEKLQLC